MSHPSWNYLKLKSWIWCCMGLRCVSIRNPKLRNHPIKIIKNLNTIPQLTSIALTRLELVYIIFGTGLRFCWLKFWLKQVSEGTSLGPTLTLHCMLWSFFASTFSPWAGETLDELRQKIWDLEIDIQTDRANISHVYCSGIVPFSWSIPGYFLISNKFFVDLIGPSSSWENFYSGINRHDVHKDDNKQIRWSLVCKPVLK